MRNSEVGNGTIIFELTHNEEFVSAIAPCLATVKVIATKSWSKYSQILTGKPFAKLYNFFICFWMVA
ncbi:hypothetical protein [Nostoc sp.]|uniref:hypothetical protein n=1 Tax=Nostoc sp. TaxID=1180 RepID=UPI002FF9638F